MAGIDDISKKLEELQKQIKLIAKDVELGNVEVDKEKIKSLEKELSIWEKKKRCC